MAGICLIPLSLRRHKTLVLFSFGLLVNLSYGAPNHDNVTSDANSTGCPLVYKGLPDVLVTVGDAVEFDIPENAFKGNFDVMQVTSRNDGELPGWLRYNSSERLFEGNPGQENVGTLEIKIVVNCDQCHISCANVSTVFNIIIQSQDPSGTDKAGMYDYCLLQLQLLTSSAWLPDNGFLNLYSIESMLPYHYCDPHETVHDLALLFKPQSSLETKDKAKLLVNISSRLSVSCSKLTILPLSLFTSLCKYDGLLLDCEYLFRPLSTYNSYVQQNAFVVMWNVACDLSDEDLNRYISMISLLQNDSAVSLEMRLLKRTPEFSRRKREIPLSEGQHDKILQDITPLYSNINIPSHLLPSFYQTDIVPQTDPSSISFLPGSSSHIPSEFSESHVSQTSGTSSDRSSVHVKTVSDQVLLTSAQRLDDGFYVLSNAIEASLLYDSNGAYISSPQATQIGEIQGEATLPFSSQQNSNTGQTGDSHISSASYLMNSISLAEVRTSIKPTGTHGLLRATLQMPHLQFQIKSTAIESLSSAPSTDSFCVKCDSSEHSLNEYHQPSSASMPHLLQQTTELAVFQRSNSLRNSESHTVDDASSNSNILTPLKSFLDFSGIYSTVSDSSLLSSPPVPNTLLESSSLLGLSRFEDLYPIYSAIQPSFTLDLSNIPQTNTPEILVVSSSESEIFVNLHQSSFSNVLFANSYTAVGVSSLSYSASPSALDLSVGVSSLVVTTTSDMIISHVPIFPTTVTEMQTDVNLQSLQNSKVSNSSATVLPDSLGITWDSSEIVPLLGPSSEVLSHPSSTVNLDPTPRVVLGSSSSAILTDISSMFFLDHSSAITLDSSYTIIPESSSEVVSDISSIIILDNNAIISAPGFVDPSSTTIFDPSSTVLTDIGFTSNRSDPSFAVILDPSSSTTPGPSSEVISYFSATNSISANTSDQSYPIIIYPTSTIIQDHTIEASLGISSIATADISTAFTDLNAFSQLTTTSIPDNSYSTAQINYTVISDFSASIPELLTSSILDLMSSSANPNPTVTPYHDSDVISDFSSISFPITSISSPILQSTFIQNYNSTTAPYLITTLLNLSSFSADVASTVIPDLSSPYEVSAKISEYSVALMKVPSSVVPETSFTVLPAFTVNPTPSLSSTIISGSRSVDTEGGLADLTTLLSGSYRDLHATSTVPLKSLLTTDHSSIGIGDPNFTFIPSRSSLFGQVPPSTAITSGLDFSSTTSQEAHSSAILNDGFFYSSIFHSLSSTLSNTPALFVSSMTFSDVHFKTPLNPSIQDSPDISLTTIYSDEVGDSTSLLSRLTPFIFQTGMASYGIPSFDIASTNAPILSNVHATLVTDLSTEILKGTSMYHFTTSPSLVGPEIKLSTAQESSLFSSGADFSFAILQATPVSMKTKAVSENATAISLEADITSFLVDSLEIAAISSVYSTATASLEADFTSPTVTTVLQGSNPTLGIPEIPTTAKSLPPVIETPEALSSLLLETEDLLSASAAHSILEITPSTVTVDSVMPSTSIATTDEPTVPTNVSPKPPNKPPILVKPLGRLEIGLGQHYQLKVPSDTFMDAEDGDTRNLTLSLYYQSRMNLPRSLWIQLNSSSQTIYAIPLSKDFRAHPIELVLAATDSGGLVVMDTITVLLKAGPLKDFSHNFVITLDIEESVFMASPDNLIAFITKLRKHFMDTISGSVSILSVNKGSVIISWANSTLSKTECEKFKINQLYHKISDSQGGVNSGLFSSMLPEFYVSKVGFGYRGICVPSVDNPLEMTTSIMRASSPRHGMEWYEIVLPALVVVFSVLLFLFIGVMCFRRCRHRGQSVLRSEKDEFVEFGHPTDFELHEMNGVPCRPLVLEGDPEGNPSGGEWLDERPPAPNYSSPDGKRVSQSLDCSPLAEPGFDNGAYQPPPVYRIPPTYSSPGQSHA